MTKRKISVYALIVLALYLAATAFFGISLATTVAGIPEGGSTLGLGIFLAVVVLIIGCIVYGFITLLALIGLVVAIKKKRPMSRRLFYVVMLLLPAVTEVVLMLVGMAFT